ncbi:MAG: transcription termination factor NusA [Patescibacteria group bacterium]|nr:transcription termination factor NusA [Patescibacteria group bacterium]
MSSPIEQAIKQICEEKGLAYEAVLETIESALASAYRKDFGEKNQNLKVEFNPETAGLRVFDVKTVVEDKLFEEYEKELEERAKAREEAEAQAVEGKVEEPKVEDPKPTEEKKDKEKAEETDEKEEEKPRFSPKLHIPLSEAKKLKKTAKIDDVITTELEIPSEFGRMAAQTAKQVITQRLREAERNNVYNEFKEKEQELINGIVQRREGRVILIDLGRITGVIPPDGQIQSEKYNSGDRFKVYVSSVEMGTKGPEITVSRSHPEMVRELFVAEIPEIAEGTVEIHSISREAGSRSKVAVSSKEENVDPVGSCIGQRGTRIQTIIHELGGEKIDIVEYDEDSEKFIINALSPAKIQKIKLSEKEKTAIAYVATDQLSLAIGKGGQNVRLAARLTGWKITVEELKDDKKTKKEEKKEVKEEKEIKEEKTPEKK